MGLLGCREIVILARHSPPHALPESPAQRACPGSFPLAVRHVSATSMRKDPGQPRRQYGTRWREWSRRPEVWFGHWIRGGLSPLPVRPVAGTGRGSGAATSGTRQQRAWRRRRLVLRALRPKPSSNSVPWMLGYANAQRWPQPGAWLQPGTRMSSTPWCQAKSQAPVGG